MVRIFRALLIMTALVAIAQAGVLDIGPFDQDFTSSALSRGYWFTAPEAFTITSLRVPTDVGTGDQYIEVVRFSGTPTTYPEQGTNFTELAYFAGITGSNWATANIAVNANDVIGILGIRWDGALDHNSYGNSPYVSSIDGLPVTLTRLGVQADLHAGPAATLFTESGGSIGRVEMTYGPVGNGTPEPGTFSLFALAGGAGLVAFRGRRK